MNEAVYALTLASTYLLFSLGLSIAWGTIGVLNFAHGSIFMFSAFGVHQITQHVDLGTFAMVVAGVLIGSLLSLLVHFLAFEPLRRRSHSRDRGMQMLVVGVGLSAVPVALANRSTGGNPFGLQGDFSSVSVGSVRVTTIDIVVIVAAVIVTAATAWWLASSRHGLALRAIGVDDDNASMLGVNRARLATILMAFAGALAGLSGVLLTLKFGAISPATGEFLILKAFAITIIGGVGSVPGVVLGSTVLAVSETLVITHTAGTWVDAISFVIILVLLLVRPQGVFGKRAVVKA
jgi:branched-chain amino acid transport system permease protein